MEHHPGAVGPLLEMMDALVVGLDEQGYKASYRLLRFDNPKELDPNDYRDTEEILEYTHRIPWGNA